MDHGLAVVGIVISLLLAMWDPKGAATHWRFLLWLVIIGGGIYSGTELIFQGVGPMRFAFWPSVVVGAMIGAVAVGVAWKHVQPVTTPAEAQLNPPTTPQPAQRKDSAPTPAPVPPASQKTEGANSPAIWGNNNSVIYYPPVNPAAPVTTYDFNGGKRITSPGRSYLEVGNESEVFVKLQTLYDAKDWSGIIAIAEPQIQKTPTWYTPHLYAGVAYAHLNQKAMAIQRLQEVVNNAGGRPEYSDAERNLRLIKGP